MATHSSVLTWRIPMDRGAPQVIVHGVAKSQTQLSYLPLRHSKPLEQWFSHCIVLQSYEGAGFTRLLSPTPRASDLVG